MQNTEAERAVIGALVMDFDLSESAVSLLTAEDFSDEPCRAAFAEILLLKANGQPVNIVTLVQRLGEECKGALVEWCQFAPLLTTLQSTIELVKSNADIRRLQALLYEDVVMTPPALNATELICSIEQKLERIKKTALASGSENNFKTHATAYLSRLEGNAPVKKALTGYAALDSILGGLPRGELTGIAARPRVGKSTFMLNLAHRFWKQGKRVLIDSLEMSEEQIIQKLAEIETGVSAEHVRDYTLTDREKEAVKQSVSRFSADDRMEIIGDGYTVQKLMAKARQHRSELVLVDYLQYMLPEKPSANRNAEVGSISRAMKFMAKALGIPVVLLSQINRDSEKNPSKGFSLSDLRDSGEIEQDLAAVIFLDRKGLLNPQISPEDMDVIVAKNRFGRTGVAKLRFELPTQRIFSVDTYRGELPSEIGGERPF